jgi:hypothetical protein
MLGKTPLAMMVLLVAASLIGISSVHQYLEAQTPTPKTQQTVQLGGQVTGAIMVVSPNKSCTGFVDLPADKPNLLRLPPGTSITLTAPIESCTLFGLAKTSNTPISFVVTAPTAAASTERQYRAIQVIL